MSRTLEGAIRFHTEEAGKLELHPEINKFILGIEGYERAKEEHTQTAEWLKELAERRKLPERKVGEWVQVPRFEGDTQPYLECPFCKNKVGWWDLARYCNGCGAKLEGGAG